MKRLLLAVAIATVLAFGFAPDEDTVPEPVVVPPPAPELVVPLEISETTQPVGWVEPAELTIEQELGRWLLDLAGTAIGQAVGALTVLSFLVTMIVALEKSRDDGSKYG